MQNLTYESPDHAKTRLTVLSIVFFLVLPILSGGALTFILSKINGDVLYEDVSSFLDSAKYVIDWIIMYFSLALLCVSVISRRRILRTIILYAVSLLIPYAGSFIATALLTTDFASMLSFYAVQSIIGLTGNALIMASAAVISMLLRRGTERRTAIGQTVGGALIPFKNPFATSFFAVCIILLVVNILREVTITVSFFEDYGATATTDEIVSMVTAYLLFFAYAVLGWFVMAAAYFSVFGFKKTK